MAYITSNDYENVIYSGESDHRIRIWFNDIELEDADYFCEKLTVSSRILPNDSSKRFSLDNFISKELTLILHNVDLSKIVDKVKISLGTMVNGEYEDVPLGIFNIQDTPTTDKNKITVKLRDNAVLFDFGYNAEPLIKENGGTATKLQILKDMCEQAGVVCKVFDFLGQDETVGVYDNTITARVYISYIAEEAGAIATINRNGELIFTYLKEDIDETTFDTFGTINNQTTKNQSGIVIDGKSKQETTPSPDYPSEIESVSGKNLFDVNQELQTYTVGGNTRRGFELPNGLSNVVLSVQPKENYEFIEAGFQIRLLNDDGTNDLVDGIVTATNRVVKKLTLDPTKKYIFVCVSSSMITNVKLYLDSFNWQLEKGIVVTDYVPYKHIGIKVTGKNLAYNDWAEEFVSRVNSDTKAKLEIYDGRNCLWYNASAGYQEYDKKYLFKIDWKENTQYTFKASVYATDPNGWLNLCIEYTDNSVQEITSKPNEWENVVFISQANKTIKYLRSFYRNNSSYIDLDTFMVYQGIEDAQYEPYKENITTLLLNESLRSLPNGVRDKLYVQNNKLYVERYVGSDVLDGSENWGSYSLNETRSSFYTAFSGEIKSYTNIEEIPVLICSHFKPAPQSNTWKSGDISRSVNQNNLFLTMPSGYTINSFKTWLSTNNVQVDYELATPTTEELGDLSIPLFEGVNNVSLLSTIGTTMLLQYYKPKNVHRIPLSIVEKYTLGEKFKISRVVYEDAIRKYETGTQNNDTLFLNSANPFISNQIQIDKMFQLVENFEIDSLITGKILGNPSIDPYDIIEIYDDYVMEETVIARTLANHSLTYNGAITTNFNTEIGIEEKKENVSIKGEATFKKWAKTEIDNVEASVKITTGEIKEVVLDLETDVNNNSVNINNNYQEILGKFEGYTPTSQTIQLEKSVTQLQTDTYTKTEINTKLTDGSVTKVLTTSGTFDENGMHYEKTGAKTSSTVNEKGIGVDSTTTGEELLFAGYDEEINQTIVRTENLTVRKYLVIGENSRIEDYGNGGGVFIL